MNEVIVIDESGPVRYNWPEIKLLYMGGATAQQIANALSAGNPESTETIRAAIAKQSSRNDWPSELASITQKVSEAKNGRQYLPDGQNNTQSLSVTEASVTLASERKARYLEITSKFADRAAKTLDQRQIDTLEDAAMAAKLFQPVHELARDIHGLNGKDVGNQVQVNILSDWANKVPDFVNYVDAQEVAKDNT